MLQHAMCTITGQNTAWVVREDSSKARLEDRGAMHDNWQCDQDCNNIFGRYPTANLFLQIGWINVHNIISDETMHGNKSP